jgi:hypothetical protein
MDIAGAYQLLRARLESGKPDALAFLRFQNEDEPEIPDTPAPFAYAEFNNLGADMVGFGGGLGQNRYRSRARLDVYVFVPRGEGIGRALTLAEAIAALYRSYREDELLVVAASTIPGGDGADSPVNLDSPAGNYFWALAEIELVFDQTG